MNDEFKQRRDGSLVREKDCHHRGVALRMDEGGVREQANVTRTSLIHVNVETREILNRQNDLSMLASTLTNKVENVGNQLRATENDIVDAERLSSGSVNTYDSHQEKHAKNVAIVDELINYLKKGTPGGDVLTQDGSIAPMTTITTSLRPPVMAEEIATSLVEEASLLEKKEEPTESGGSEGEGEGEGGGGGESAAVHSSMKLTSLLNDMKQSMVDFAPKRDMSHEQLKESHSQLISALESKMTRLESELKVLQAEKLQTSSRMEQALVDINKVTTKSSELERTLGKQKIYLSSVAQHITKHEKMCDMMEIKFNELRTMMMDDLGIVKVIKNMLGANQMKRVKVVAETMASDLETAIPSAL